MSFNANSAFRKVNPTLDKQPRVGPIPADQLIPWLLACGAAYYIGRLLLGLSWVWTGVVAAWGMSTWWILTAKGAWRFFGKFVAVPHWVRGQGIYRSVFASKEEKTWKPSKLARAASIAGKPSRRKRP
ncbi:hypothetical protein [Lusitaniella coriacea]|uniref:hypothetical protein n=1 Tax=Lusitaniella coriacea TaxID=1983105 RepID=UPI003CF86F9A